MKGDSGYLGFERVDGISRDATGTSAADGQVQCPQCGAWYPAWKEHHCPQVSSGSTAPTDGIVWIKYKPLGEPHEPGIIEQLSAQIASLEAQIAGLDRELREMEAAYTQRGYEMDALRSEKADLERGMDYNMLRANAAEAKIAEQDKQLRELAEALASIKEQQPKVLAMLRREGFVLDNLDERWQKLAFTLYSEIVDSHMIARAVLDIDEARAAGLLSGKPDSHKCVHSEVEDVFGERPSPYDLGAMHDWLRRVKE